MIERMTDDNNAVMAAFADKVENVAAIRPAGPNQVVQMRPVGAQAMTVYRDEGKILQKLRVFAAAAGEAWFYSWDVNDKNSRRADKKTTIEGPSVKLANDLARIYGNCSNGVERVEDIGSHWIFHARFVDYETGYEYSRPFQQRKSQGQGQGTQADRQADIAFQIGASKAVRNCVVNALGTFTDFAMAEAKSSMVERVGKDLERYRVRAVNRLEQLGVELVRVERLVGKPHSEWTAKHVAKLIAEIQAVNEGMTTPEEIWPVDAPADPTKPGKLEHFAGETVKPTDTDMTKVEATDGAAIKAKQGALAAAAAKAASEGGKLAGQEVTKGADILKEAAKPAETNKPAAKSTMAGKPTSEQVAENIRAAEDARPEVQGDTFKPAPAKAQDQRGAQPSDMEAAARVGSRPPPLPPTDAKGAAVQHDATTGEATDDLEVPDFLRRDRRGISDSPEDRRNPEEVAKAAKAMPDHLNMEKVREWFPDKPPQWLSGYIARGQGVPESDNPHAAAPKVGNTWRAGWLTRDGDPDEMPLD